jgi:exonuclease III
MPKIPKEIGPIMTGEINNTPGIDNRYNTLTILHYNVGKRYSVMQNLLLDPRAWKYDIIAIQEPYRMNINDVPTTTNPAADRFYLFYPPHIKTRVCFLINRRIPRVNIQVTDHGPDMVSIALINPADRHSCLKIYNVYNPCPKGNPHEGKRVHNLPLETTLPRLHNALNRHPDKVIIVGDFNIWDPLWGGPGTENTKLHKDSAEYLKAILEAHALDICTPEGTVTRPLVKGNYNIGTTIDLCFASEGIMDSLLQCKAETKLDHDSDHLPMLLELGYAKGAPKTNTRWMWKDLDEEKFEKAFQSGGLNALPNEATPQDIDKAIKQLVQNLQDAIKQAVLKARICPYLKAWFNDTCSTAIKERKRARRRYQQTQLEADFIAFQLARRAAAKAIHRAARDRHRVKVSQVKDMEGLWKLSKWQRNRGTIRQSFTPGIVHPQTQQVQ